MNPVLKTDNLKTALIMQKIATQNKKNQIISKASTSLYKFLTANKFSPTGTKIAHCNSDGLVGGSLFDGLLKFAVKISEGRTVKEAEIPVRIVKSQVVLPDISVVARKVASIQTEDKVAKAVSVHTQKVASMIDTNFKAINSPFMYKKAHTVATPEDKMVKNKKQVEEYIGKVEKIDYKVPETKWKKENPNYVYTLNWNSNDKYLEHFKISKTSLPESVQIGDILNFADKRYKVTTDDGKGNWGLDYIVKEEK